MREYLEYLLYAVLFFVSSCVFIWMLAAVFSALFGAAR